ncbi:hypothetical protein HPB47_017975 [Ixodes persulcatus]|uniref:Uncharacterized protein n=1 Tax=Ixodes persulcatus TaxID=34615 RepID=A0AC60QLW5_IXOPE|nr:hypothetical protein HPB47_017975 [Ixodes persulcatus]
MDEGEAEDAVASVSPAEQIGTEAKQPSSLAECDRNGPSPQVIGRSMSDASATVEKPAPQPEGSKEPGKGTTKADDQGDGHNSEEDDVLMDQTDNDNETVQAGKRPLERVPPAALEDDVHGTTQPWNSVSAKGCRMSAKPRTPQDNHKQKGSKSVDRYLLTTELTRSWTSTIQDAFRESLKNARALRLQKVLSWPTEEDLTGAAVGLCRLQHTYRLSVAQMADLKSPSLNASAHDRMEVAARCFKSGDVKSAVGWWTSSLDELEEEEQPTEDWENVLRSLMTTTLRFRDKTTILNLLSAYDFGASKDERARLVDLAQKDPELEHSPVGDDAASFSQLCDSEFPSAGHLRCKLATNENHPLLLLQPLKLEVLSEDPRIVLVHDFVGARERRMIRELAYPILYRATNSFTEDDLKRIYLCCAPQNDCFLRRCEKCPNMQSISLQSLHLDEEEEICFALWDAGELVKKVMGTSAFLRELESEKYMRHSYIRDLQRCLIYDTRTALLPKAVMFHFDFAEKWTVLFPTEVQSFY